MLLSHGEYYEAEQALKSAYYRLAGQGGSTQAEATEAVRVLQEGELVQMKAGQTAAAADLHDLLLTHYGKLGAPGAEKACLATIGLLDIWGPAGGQAGPSGGDGDDVAGPSGGAPSEADGRRSFELAEKAVSRALKLYNAAAKEGAAAGGAGGEDTSAAGEAQGEQGTAAGAASGRAASSLPPELVPNLLHGLCSAAQACLPRAEAPATVLPLLAVSSPPEETGKYVASLALASESAKYDADLFLARTALTVASAKAPGGYVAPLEAVREAAESFRNEFIWGGGEWLETPLEGFIWLFVRALELDAWDLAEGLEAQYASVLASSRDATLAALATKARKMRCHVPRRPGGGLEGLLASLMTGGGAGLFA